MCRIITKGQAFCAVGVPAGVVPQGSKIRHLDCQPIRKAWSENQGKCFPDVTLGV